MEFSGKDFVKKVGENFPEYGEAESQKWKLKDIKEEIIKPTRVPSTYGPMDVPSIYKILNIWTDLDSVTFEDLDQPNKGWRGNYIHMVYRIFFSDYIQEQNEKAKFRRERRCFYYKENENVDRHSFQRENFLDAV